MSMRNLWCLTFAAWMLLDGAARAAEDLAKIREMLPDFSANRVGVLGPFWWGRSVDMGEDARFSDADGRPRRDGDFLWCYGFARQNAKDDTRGLNGVFLHARNNFVSRFGGIAYQVQPWQFILNTPGSHNSKVSLGYVPDDFRFVNGDNTDLEHIAACPRIVLFLPVRHGGNPDDHTDQGIYYVSPHYSAQSASVLEFAPGEIIDYGWYANPSNLDAHIICDLVPYLSGANEVRPGVTKPLVRFDLTGEKGGWRVRIERDGRDGLAGGTKDGDWDIDITSGSPGARPYSVSLDPTRARWAMSVFSPGGSPTDTSEMLLGLQPYDRTDGSPTTWRDRNVRVRSGDAAKLLAEHGEKPASPAK